MALFGVGYPVQDCLGLSHPDLLHAKKTKLVPPTPHGKHHMCDIVKSLKVGWTHISQIARDYVRFCSIV